MAKGSQLSQLKTALTKAGVSGPPESRKRKRSSVSTSKDKDRQAAQLEAIHSRFNAFDVKETKLKHNVLGKGKIKGQKGTPSKSKQSGLDARKKTLQKEWEDRGRAGGILDRRFGETDATMSLEEKMLERFTRERQRASTSKGDLFNLDDEDELTHYGQSLANLDDFENAGMGFEEDEDEDERSGQIEGRVVRRSHFGGFGEEEEDSDGEGQPARKKTKSEVMAEVIQKSKEHKFRRQLERQQDDNLRHQLDQEFDSLRDLLLAAEPPTHAPDPAPEPKKPLPIPPTPETGVAELIPSAPSMANPESYAKDTTYDALVKELAFDARSKPKDRTKTEEELASEERERLLKAEKKRRLGMLGLDDPDSVEAGGKRKRAEADDLEDDFDGGYGDDEEDDWAGVGKGIGEGPDEGGSEEGDEDSSAEGDEAAPYESGQPLPFTFPCPSTHAQLLSILKNVSDEDVPTVIKRIRALYHTSLGAGNKVKLQTLSGVLLEHILHCAPNFTLVRNLIPHLAALTKQYPRQATEHFVAQLSSISQRLFSQPVSSEYRFTLRDLTLLRLIPLCFPTSDLHHLVVSPARLLIGAYLSLSLPKLKEVKDVASGLFAVSLVLEWENVSKRWVPEVPVYLVNVVLRMAPLVEEGKALPGMFPVPRLEEARERLALKEKQGRQLAVVKPNLVMLLKDNDYEPTEQDKVNLLGLAVGLIGSFSALWEGLPSFIEVFEPLDEVLGMVDLDLVSKDLKSRISSCRTSLGQSLKLSKKTRQPLQLQSHKPIPLPSIAPQFSERSSTSYLFREDDPDKEANKLRKAYKQERKGAIRELRKDTRFLAKVEQDRQREKDEEYEKRMRQVHGGIEGERAEQKSAEREKMKEKKRAGRK
ncbi:nucleolar protein 14 [Flagelloscypha sp. PMI_526]|nr:nucleolar protein 14 [Flagelloscypha sp. PMI_526]